MSTQTFRSKLTKSGSKVILPIPFDPNEAWGVRERHHITGKIQDVVYRGAVQSENGAYFLSIGPVWLRDSHLELGQELEVSLDAEGPQLERMPEDIAAELAANPSAKAFFEALPTFYRKNYMRWLESAKRAETRQARIREIVALLAAGKRER